MTVDCANRPSTPIRTTEEKPDLRGLIGVGLCSLGAHSHSVCELPRSRGRVTLFSTLSLCVGNQSCLFGRCSGAKVITVPRIYIQATTGTQPLCPANFLEQSLFSPTHGRWGGCRRRFTESRSASHMYLLCVM